jgi:hypothetical protein
MAVCRLRPGGEMRSPSLYTCIAHAGVGCHCTFFCWGAATFSHAVHTTSVAQLALQPRLLASCQHLLDAQ